MGKVPPARAREGRPGSPTSLLLLPSRMGRRLQEAERQRESHQQLPAQEVSKEMLHLRDGVRIFIGGGGGGAQEIMSVHAQSRVQSP